MKSKPTKKSRAKKAEVINISPLVQPKLATTTYCWDGAFPYLKEKYLLGKEELEVGAYIASDDTQFVQFLYKILRSPTPLPGLYKSNFNKIRKHIKNELKHRSKLEERLSKEQKHAMSVFFKDPNFFRYPDSDFFELEVEKALVTFLQATLETKFYETFVRQGLRTREAILSKYGRL